MAEDKNIINNGENEESRAKKRLITEKITGRQMTLNRAVKYVGVAAACGAAFGLAAALTFCGINTINEMGSGDIDGRAPYGNVEVQMTDNDGTDFLNDETDEANESGDISGESGQNNGKPGGESIESGGSLNGDTAEQGENAEGGHNESFSDSGSEQENDIETQDNGENDILTSDPADPHGNELSGESGDSEERGEEIVLSLSEQREKVIDESRKYFVSVSSTSTGTTWFANEESNTETFSGVILTVGREEILILTTDDAARSETIRVTFHNGVSVDAYVKQYSSRDGLAVLAVSAVNGMDVAMLEELKGIDVAPRGTIKSGEMVIACGSPLGIDGSYSFGNIGYISEDEAGYDVSQRALYTDAASDEQKGTFLIDYDGKLIGMASTESESVNVTGNLTRIVAYSSLSDTINSLKEGEKIAYLGVMGSAVSFDMKYNGVPEGCYVTGVDQDSPAYNAGIMRGDIISSLNGTEVKSMEELSRLVKRTAPGSSMEIILKRAAGGEYRDMTFTVTAGER